MTTRRIAKRAERLPLAGIAGAMLGCAVAFFCFAMPDRLVGALIASLGGTGRALLAILLGGVVGVATWRAIRRLDRAPAAVVRAEREETPSPPPRRRADLHPDAPPRRPIFAEAELGTPLDLVEPLPKGWQEPEPASAEPEIVEGEIIEAEIVRPEPIEAVVVEPEPREDTHEWPAPPHSEPSSEPSPEPSIAALMARLESAIDRAETVTPLHRDEGRLRSAIDELQRMAARGR